MTVEWPLVASLVTTGWMVAWWEISVQIRLEKSIVYPMSCAKNSGMEKLDEKLDGA